MMPPLTFVTTCMARLSFLKQTLPRFVAQPRCEVIVVDYSCPENTSNWVQAHHSEVRVLRVPGNSTFNMTRARNAGAALVQSPWICFIDADIMLHPAFAETVLPQVKSGNFYRPNSESSGIDGTFIVSREDFQKSGGCDEVFRTYGDDDYDLFDNLRMLGVKQRTYPAQLVGHLHHGDDRRTENFECKEHLKGVLVNRCYRIIKWELARNRDQALSSEERQTLYDELFVAAPAALIQRVGGYPLKSLVDFIAREITARGGEALTPPSRERISKAILKP